MKLAVMKPRDRRMLAVGLALLVLVLAYFALLHWWFVAPLRAINAEMDDLRDSHSRYVAAIEQKPLLQKRIAQLGEGAAASVAFLPEDDPSAAGAYLMQKVVDATAAHAQDGPCEVTQKMPLATPPRAAGEPYRKIGVTIGLRCDVAPLAGVLHDIEQGAPYLFIDDFGVFRNPVAAQQGAVASLEVQLVITGYVRPSHAPKGAPQVGSSTEFGQGDAL